VLLIRDGALRSLRVGLLALLASVILGVLVGSVVSALLLLARLTFHP